MIAMKRLMLLVLCVLAVFPVMGLAQSPLKVEQEGFVADVVPLTGSAPAETVYAYEGLRSQGPWVPEPGHSVLFFYRDTGTGTLSLVVLHGPPALDVTNATGLARFLLSDLPEGVTLALLDDPDDDVELSPPALRLRWKWHTGRTDGMVLSGFGEDFSVKLLPHFIQGVTHWELLSAGPDGTETIPLPSLERPVRLAMGAAAGRGARAVFRVSGPDGTLRTLSPLTFDARESLAPEGSRLIRYRWDFDGDGLFELESVEPVVTYTYSRGGSRAVTLEVEAEDGSRARTTQVLALVATQAVRAHRELSTPTALPGEPFRVRLTLTVEQEVHGLGVEERWPAGWRIEGVQNDGAVLKAASRQWIFPQRLKPGQVKTLIYDVVPPPGERLGELPRSFRVEGTLTSDLPRFLSAIEGESAVEVASCLPTPVALAHLDLERGGRLDLRLSEKISASQAQHARNLWLAGLGLPGACAETVSLEALQRILLYRELGLAVDEPLPQGDLRPGVRVERTVETQLPENRLYLPGGDERFRVRLEITALRPAFNVGLSEYLPFGWQVVPELASDVLFNPKTTQWLILTPLQTGKTRVLTYEVVLPPDERPAVFLLRGGAQLPDSPFVEVIEGEARLETIACLPVLWAVAHWNLETDEIDLALDNRIQLDQAQAAMDLWLEDAPVPGTCGAHLDFETLQLVVNYALAGVPVDRPL